MKAKLTYVDDQLIDDLIRNARKERAALLRRLREDEDPNHYDRFYKDFRKDYVTKHRWLHSGKGI